MAYQGGLYLPRKYRRSPPRGPFEVNYANPSSVGLIHATVPINQERLINAVTGAIGSIFSGTRGFSTINYRGDACPATEGQYTSPGASCEGEALTSGPASMFGLIGVGAPVTLYGIQQISSYPSNWNLIQFNTTNSTPTNDLKVGFKCGDGTEVVLGGPARATGRLWPMGGSYKRGRQIAWIDGNQYSNTYDPGTDSHYSGAGTKWLTSGYGFFGLGYVWKRFVEAAEFQQIADNPWQLFHPIRSKGYFFDMTSSPLVLGR